MSKSKENPTSILSREEVEGSLADFAFGQIEETRHLAMERALPHYPDLQEELEQIRTVFARFDKMEFKADLSLRARSLSVHVHENLARQRERNGMRNHSLKRLLPFGVFAILATLVLPPFDILNYFSDKAATQVSVATAPDRSSDRSAQTTPGIIDLDGLDELIVTTLAQDDLPGMSRELAATALVNGTSFQNDILENESSLTLFDDTEFDDNLFGDFASSAFGPNSGLISDFILPGDFQERELQQLFEELDGNATL